MKVFCSSQRTHIYEKGELRGLKERRVKWRDRGRVSREDGLREGESRGGMKERREGQETEGQEEGESRGEEGGSRDRRVNLE